MNREIAKGTPKKAGGCGDDPRFHLSPHPPRAQFLLGTATLADPTGAAIDFQNNFRSHYGCIF
jgi:hypothetical protein